MSNPYANCTEVTSSCPVSASPLGYAPNAAGNAILFIVFSLCFLAQLFLMFWKRTWSFGIVVLIGTGLEVTGYIGRLILHTNAWNSTGMILNIVCLIVAPSFLAAGIYLTLKHIVLYLGPEYSRLKPVLWVWIFVGGDVGSVVGQAIGAVVASTADTVSTANTGNDIMIGGLTIGVVMQFLCILLALDFGWAVYRDRETFRNKPHTSETSSRGFLFYMICTSFAFLFIFIRSIYRIPELVGGWGNPLMQKEVDFMILDGMMIALACILMSVAHPGIFFPAISSKNSQHAKVVDPEAGKESRRSSL